MNLQPSPSWGRGWTASGAFISRGRTGEGVKTVGIKSKVTFVLLLHGGEDLHLSFLTSPAHLPHSRINRRRRAVAAATGSPRRFALAPTMAHPECERNVKVDSLPLPKSRRGKQAF